jgi:hypothetical protein
MKGYILILFLILIACIMYNTSSFGANPFNNFVDSVTKALTPVASVDVAQKLIQDPPPPVQQPPAVTQEEQKQINEQIQQQLVQKTNLPPPPPPPPPQDPIVPISEISSLLSGPVDCSPDPDPTSDSLYAFAKVWQYPPDGTDYNLSLPIIQTSLSAAKDVLKSDCLLQNYGPYIDYTHVYTFINNKIKNNNTLYTNLTINTVKLIIYGMYTLKIPQISWESVLGSVNTWVSNNLGIPSPSQDQINEVIKSTKPLPPPTTPQNIKDAVFNNVKNSLLRSPTTSQYVATTIANSVVNILDTPYGNSVVGIVLQSSLSEIVTSAVMETDKFVTQTVMSYMKTNDVLFSSDTKDQAVKTLTQQQLHDVALKAIKKFLV